MFCPDQALQLEENKAPTIHGTFELNTKLAFIKNRFHTNRTEMNKSCSAIFQKLCV